MMRKIITTMMRPKLEYAEVIWFTHKKNYVLKLERTENIARFERFNIQGKIKRNANDCT